MAQTGQTKAENALRALLDALGRVEDTRSALAAAITHAKAVLEKSDSDGDRETDPSLKPLEEPFRTVLYANAETLYEGDGEATAEEALIKEAVKNLKSASIYDIMTVDDFVKLDAEDAAEMGVVITEKTADGRPRWHHCSHTSHMEMEDALDAFLGILARSVLQTAGVLRAKADAQRPTLEA